MATFQELHALIGSAPLRIPIETTRFAASATDLPLTSRYTSLFDDMQAQIDRHIYKDKLRQIALHPLKLHAGKAELPKGELGRPAAPDPVMTPEILGGRVLRTNV